MSEWPIVTPRTDYESSTRPSEKQGLPATRFERQMVSQNFLNQLQIINEKSEVIVKTIRKLDYTERSKGYHGVTKRGEMYQIGVSFALENTSIYSEPLPSVEGNRLYQIRMALAQYQAYPLVMGWSLQWQLPAGWSWADGLGATTHEEFISNPTVVIRYVKSPLNPAPSGFRIIVVGKYA